MISNRSTSRVVLILLVVLAIGLLLFVLRPLATSLFLAGVLAGALSPLYENLVRNLPSIIRETVKPMENIESIKILQVDGVPGINSPSELNGSGAGNANGGGEGPNMTDRVVSSAMKYRTQVAFVDGLMKELGLPLENIGSAGGMSFRNFQPPEKPAGSARRVGKPAKDDD